MMLELNRIIREQQEDDNAFQRPEQVGGGHTIPLEATESSSRLDSYFTDASADPALAYAESEVDTSNEWVMAVIDTLPEKQQEAYRMVMVERMTLRDAATELNISHMSLYQRLEYVKAAVADEAERRGLYR